MTSERGERGEPADVRLSFVPPRPDEFKRPYDHTGWAEWEVKRFESELDGS